jgi:hypothetical protein
MLISSWRGGRRTRGCSGVLVSKGGYEVLWSQLTQKSKLNKIQRKVPGFSNQKVCLVDMNSGSEDRVSWVEKKMDARKECDDSRQGDGAPS